MREIKFRGYRTDKNEWVTGYLAYFYDKIPFISEDCCLSVVPDDKIMQENKEALLGGFMEVNPNSIGQYTGLKDKNGKYIYEGDILKLIDEDESEITAYVTFVDYVAKFVLKEQIGQIGYLKMEIWGEENMEVIGNIFENKHLLIG
nr:MAG TPA: YopX protein [Caudoviricetes sp.]